MENDSINWNQVTVNLTGLALQGLLEREESTLSKVVSDVMYKRLAKHAVSIAVECTKLLKEELEEK